MTQDPKAKSFSWSDAAEIFVGAFALAIPMATSLDTFEISDELSFGNLVAIVVVTAAVIGGINWAFYHQGQSRPNRLQFLGRIMAVFVAAAASSTSVLILYDQFPFDDAGLALARVIVISFPASFAATVVDGLRLSGAGCAPGWAPPGRRG